MKNIIIFLFSALTINSCNSDIDDGNNLTQYANKVLMLQVDYTTNSFEGGKEFSFAQNVPTFSPTVVYQLPSDFGSIKVFYSELNTQLFHGTIHWMGEGRVVFPTDFLPASAFQWFDPFGPNPMPAVENIFNPLEQVYDYRPVFLPVIDLLKVRQFRQSNPNQIAKIFLYTPGVGVGNPATWKWIIMFKN